MVATHSNGVRRKRGGAEIPVPQTRTLQTGWGVRAQCVMSFEDRITGD